MEVRFYINPLTGEPHIYDHRVDEDEVLDVLFKRAGKLCLDAPGREDSRIAFGQSTEGRYLKVVYSPDADGKGLFVITAYDLTGKALAAFKRRKRRKR